MSDINIGAISEALNNKVDLPTATTPQDTVDYVVESQLPRNQMAILGTENTKAVGLNRVVRQ